MSSEDILTSGIYADIEISNNSYNSITVVTELTAGNGLFATYIDLEGGDQLDSTYLGAMYRMKRQGSLFGDISYKSTYTSSQPYATDNRVTIAFTRSVTQNAPNSSVLLPDPISSLTLSSTSVTPSQFVTGSWPRISGKSYALEAVIKLNGCRNEKGDSTSITYYGYGSDTGSYSFRISNLISPGYSCPAGSSGTLIIKRVRSGSIDPAFGGGKIRAKYVKSIGFNII